MNFPLVSLFENEDHPENYVSMNKIKLIKLTKNESDVHFSK